MEGPSTAQGSRWERLRVTWRTMRLAAAFAAGVAGTVLALSIPVSADGNGIRVQLGDVAGTDVLAPYALSYTSSVLTEQARQAAAASVPDVYDPPDLGVARTQLERLRAVLEAIDRIRLSAAGTRSEKLADLQALPEIQLDVALAELLLDLTESRWEVVRLEAVSVLEEVMRQEIRDGLEDEAVRRAPTLVDMSLPEEQAALAAHLATAFIAPNAHSNALATRAAREQAMEAVAPVVRSYATGETIVSRGGIVNLLHLEALEAYGLIEGPRPLTDLAVRTLLAVVLGCAVALYAYRAHPVEMNQSVLPWVLGGGFVAHALAMQLMVPGRAVLPYLFPAAVLPMLLAVLFGPGMGVLAALVSGALAGYLADRGLELSLYFTMSGVMGALTIGRAERLGTFFWAGLAADLGGIAILAAFRLPDPAMDVIGKASILAAALMSGLVSASLCFAALLVIGNLLGIPTTLQLIELSRPDHPLLQHILRNAPGTYQHSLQVANLAEQAARAIGANPLLTRVGALYHDAGKAVRPQFFIENQLPGQNVHDQMDPATSASVIVSHVPDGVDLARKFRLPAQVRAFIPEHHGTMEVTYQYQAALGMANGEKARIDKRDFVYPGPRPRSRETALLMLADGVEAKARAELPEDEEAIDRLVRWVIDDRLARRQLDRTDLTLKDLEAIRRSFVGTLRGMYHPRLRYPPSAPGELPAEAPASPDPSVSPAAETT